MSLFVSDEVAQRMKLLEIPFNKFGVDKYGISRKYVARGMSALEWLYRNYFSVTVRGTEHVPPRGRGMLIGNHSGGVALDAAMVLASAFLDFEQPRLAQGMAEKFINRLPFASLWSNRTGQFTGVPETAQKLLEDDRLLLVFPEGARGTAKLYKERHSLVQFGTGFMRLALKTRTPIVPFAFLGGGEAIPTIYNAYTLGKLVGAPYVPITPYLLPLPLPVHMEIEYGEPMTFQGTGTEDDEVVQGYVEQVRNRVAEMLLESCRRRGITPALGDVREDEFGGDV